MVEQRPLPVRPRPLPDETLLSWSVRLARSNALKPQALLTLALAGKRHSVMECDIDHYMRPELSRGLSVLSGRPESEIQARMLWNVLANTSVQEYNPRRPMRWMLQLVARSRRPTKPWTALCPRCLSEDAVPYFRRAWRLAFTTTCATHRLQLIERCPFCEEPFNFQNLDQGKPHADHVVPISVCGSCGQDVRDSTPQLADCSPLVAKYEQALYRTLCRGHCRVSGYGWIYACALFEVLHCLIGRCRNSRRVRCLRDEGTNRGPLFPLQAEDIPAGSFHTWDIADRHRVMCGIAALMSDWPKHFIDCGRRFGVTSYDLRGDESKLPYWFDSVVLEHFYRKWWSPSDEEVSSVRAMIRASGQPDTFYNVRRWLGLYFQKREYVTRWVEQDRPEQLRLNMRRIDCFGRWYQCP